MDTACENPAIDDYHSWSRGDTVMCPSGGSSPSFYVSKKRSLSVPIAVMPCLDLEYNQTTYFLTLGLNNFRKSGSGPFRKCTMSAPKTPVEAAFATTVSLHHRSMQLSWGPSPHCLLYIHLLCLLTVDVSSLPLASSVSSATSIIQRCVLLLQSSSCFA